MLNKYRHNGKNFDFVDRQTVDDLRNVFTIIVGKNGTGKSRLLSAIVSEFINVSKSTSVLGHDLIKTRTKFIEYTAAPGKIITISASPFDKFPIPKRGVKIEGYSYLGLRGLSGQNLGLAYMSKIISSLLDVILEDPEQMNDIANVLNYLGYGDSINIRLQVYNSRSGGYAASYRPEFIIDKDGNKREFVIVRDREHILNADNVGKKDLSALSVLVNKLDSPGFPNNFYINISRNGVASEDDAILSVRDCLLLLNSGYIKLKELYLSKLDTGKVYSITDASSGEQSVVISFLGIASQIQNNTLVCIDEPEICLHPEWQERYIKLLIDTFSRYINCHFLIATHSPQVVSNLESHNCFVLSMDDRVVTDAKEFVNQSIDFQLANVFKSPGFKNEYLSRIALSVFSKVSVRKKFDEKDIENYKILASQEKLLDDNDPVYDLIMSIKKMYKAYARNK